MLTVIGTERSDDGYKKESNYHLAGETGKLSYQDLRDGSSNDIHPRLFLLLIFSVSLEQVCMRFQLFMNLIDGI